MNLFKKRKPKPEVVEPKLLVEPKLEAVKPKQKEVKQMNKVK